MLAPAIIDALPEQLTQYGSDPDLLRGELLDIITRAIAEHPRSQQVELGPSELGHTCARRIGYAMLGYEERPSEPNWRTTVGTAIHAWLEEQMQGDNVRQSVRREADVTRWLTEMTVVVGELGGVPISGHCDLFDRVTGTVVDWKTCSPTRMKAYRASVNRGDGPGDQYRRQAHLYGRGWVARGQRVEHVAVMFLPRDGALRDAVYWHEPYDEQIAAEALQRAEGILLATRALGTAALDILPTADAFCSMCPFYKAGAEDLDIGCPGDPASRRTQQPALTLG